jgi:TDG/mug DNA glycosylase family protein
MRYCHSERSEESCPARGGSFTYAQDDNYGGGHHAVCFPPIVSVKPQTLILGSMPGVKSLQEQQYYAHPQNSFWKIMGKLFDDAAETYEQRIGLIKGNALALWDVLKSCKRDGSLDSEIEAGTIEVNDFAAFLKKHSTITRIFFNGATAEKEFMRRVLPELSQSLKARLSLKRLPSTSPAHAGLRVEKKIKEWSAICHSERSEESFSMRGRSFAALRMTGKKG